MGIKREVKDGYCTSRGSTQRSHGGGKERSRTNPGKIQGKN
jgi:hypothetical protein